MVEELKICVTCKESKELEEFPLRSDTGKRRGQCRFCHKGYKGSAKQALETTLANLTLGKKECSKCKEVKDFGFFSKDKQTVTGYCSKCKECTSSINKENKEQRKIQVAKKRYNITEETYTKLMIIPNCQICNTEFSENTHRCIDHCHDTGEVRGVLCSFCNIGIGHLKDDKEILMNAIKYLE